MSEPHPWPRTYSFWHEPDTPGSDPEERRFIDRKQAFDQNDLNRLACEVGNAHPPTEGWRMLVIHEVDS